MITVLQAACQGRGDLTMAALTEAQIRWAVHTGLGPLLYHTLRADPQAGQSPLWPFLQGANLAARLLNAEQGEAMEELIDACAGHLPPLTLLKGISISEQYYPAPHWRPMRDLDVLVEAADLPTVEALLVALGYCQQSHYPPAFYATLHHSMPFFHPHRRVWVEVHHDLFPVSSPMGADRVFSRAHLRTQLVPSTFHGRPVTRLSAALQLVYIPSHWAWHFQAVGGMIAMLDLIYLLQRTHETMCWRQPLGWLQGSVAASHLSLLLSYLTTYHLIAIPAEILPGLGRWQRGWGPLHRTILHQLIDRYLVEGHPVRRVCGVSPLGIFWRLLLWRPGHVLASRCPQG